MPNSVHTSGVVYTIDVLRNITFSVEEAVIAKAREAAKAEGTTLNELVREWMENYVGGKDRRDALEKFFASFADVDLSGPTRTREERHERL